MGGQNKIMNWQEVLEGEHHTISGNVKIISDFYMPQLKRSRRIWTYLPPNYDNSNETYPVLYMHDGQSVFDIQTNGSKQEWQVDEVLEKFFYEGKTKGVIVVAIDSDILLRREEYNPIPVSSAGPASQTDLYAEFIVKTLKPFIDANFRTKPSRDYTGIAGLSAGAICSLYIGLKYQEVFSKVGAFSFTMLKSVANMPDKLKQVFYKKDNMKIYMDVGKKETTGLPLSIKEYFVADFAQELVGFYKFLIESGFKEAELMLKIDEQGEHLVSAVAGRFPQAFLWLFGENENS